MYGRIIKGLIHLLEALNLLISSTTNTTDVPVTIINNSNSDRASVLKIVWKKGIYIKKSCPTIQKETATLNGVLEKNPISKMDRFFDLHPTAFQSEKNTNVEKI